MTIPMLLIVLAAFQAALRSPVFSITLIYAAFFSLASLATQLDFTHSLLVNSVFCLALAQYCSKKYDSWLSGAFIAMQFIAIMNCACMAIFYIFITDIYEQAISMYNSLNEILIIVNVVLLVGMTKNGGSWSYNRVA